MTGYKSIVRRLIRLREPGYAAVAAQGVEAVPTACYYLVSVALVPDIENYSVSCAVIYPVQRNGELDCS